MNSFEKMEPNQEKVCLHTFDRGKSRLTSIQWLRRMVFYPLSEAQMYSLFKMGRAQCEASPEDNVLDDSMPEFGKRVS